MNVSFEALASINVLNHIAEYIVSVYTSTQI